MMETFVIPYRISPNAAMMTRKRHAQLAATRIRQDTEYAEFGPFSTSGGAVGSSPSKVGTRFCVSRREMTSRHHPRLNSAPAFNNGFFSIALPFSVVCCFQKMSQSGYCLTGNFAIWQGGRKAGEG